MKEAQGKIGLIVLILIVLAVSAFAYLFITGRDGSKDSDEQVTGQAMVEIKSSGFVPSTIKVKKGTQVTFTNTDSASHRVASDPHPNHSGLPGFDAIEPLLTDESYSFVFEETGTFTYHDHLNPLQYKGTVIVE